MNLGKYTLFHNDTLKICFNAYYVYKSCAFEKESNRCSFIYPSVHSQPADLNPFRGTHCKELFFVWKNTLSKIYLGSHIKPQLSFS